MITNSNDPTLFTAHNEGLSAPNQTHMVVNPPDVSHFVLYSLRTFFSEPGFFEAPYFREMLKNHGPYSENSQETGFVIEMWSHWKADLVSARPGIFVRCGGFNPTEEGIQFGLDTNLEGVGTQSCAWVGEVSCIVVSTAEAEARYIAWEAARLLQQHCLDFAKMTSVAHLRVTSVGGVQPLRESQNHFAVQIGVAYTVHHQWVRQDDAPLFQRFDSTSHAERGLL